MMVSNRSRVVARLLIWQSMRSRSADSRSSSSGVTSPVTTHGSSSTIDLQLLPPLVGRARALEVILGGNLVDAELAERYGWINRALPAGELDRFVDDLARRIASLRPEQIAAAKAAVEAAATSGSLPEGLDEESKALGGVYPAPDSVVERMRAAVAAGAQTREGELDLEASLDRTS
ncbi:enoyl-CoA hydratase/isomerase family protein [Streptomyces sp. NPDC058304]|uniref:enoyl-CoA hydratase/isomerase family protein n=1 Tax=Streptomyces sp. NPDC058304 TaxID=3346437 RepID=UPI0036E4206A